MKQSNQLRQKVETFFFIACCHRQMPIEKTLFQKFPFLASYFNALHWMEVTLTTVLSP